MNGTVSTLRCAVRALLAIACVSLAHAAQADSPLRSINGAFPQARTAQPLSLAEESALHPLDHFKECETCPEMVVLPTGAFTMGAPESEDGTSPDERPQHRVTIAHPVAVGRFAITFDEWDACVAARGCKNYRPPDRGWGRGRRPVINVWWEDAQAYLRWLSDRTGRVYRLLSEAQREYATRAGTTSPFWWGAAISSRQANYDGEFPFGGGDKGEYRRMTMPVDAFESNPWGLYQMHGNVYEWVEDCWNPSYVGAPNDGSAWTTGDCNRRVMRGGSWNFAPWHLRSASRGAVATAIGFRIVGFRVARPLQQVPKISGTKRDSAED